jgi:outer membrane autotransporter protein
MRLAPFCLRTAAVLLAALLTVGTVHAQNATWLQTPADGVYNNDANWDPANTPGSGDTAFFNTSDVTSLTISAGITQIGGWTFNDGADAFAFATSGILTFDGAGIVIDGGSATITNNNSMGFFASSTAGSATITNNNNMVFDDSSTAGSATITNSFLSVLSFFGSSTAGSATITNNFILNFFDSSTAGSATITNNDRIFFFGSSTAGMAQLVNNAVGVVDFSDSTGPTGTGELTAGSLAGAGSYFLGANALTVGGNNPSTEVSGVISDCGPTGTECLNSGSTGGSLVKTGTGSFILSGANTYTGPTTVNQGTLVVNGSIVSPTTVNNGGTLMGTGQLGATTILGGGVYAPGNSIGTQTVNGNFILGSGAVYEVEVNAAGQGDRVIVTGTVNLSGAVLRVLAENGNYRPRTEYIIVDNDGNDAVQGEFAEITTNFAFLTPSVVYDGGTGNDVVLTLLRSVIPPPVPPLPPEPVSFCSVAVTSNQCNVAHALDQFPEDNELFLDILFQTADGARQAFDALSGEIHATLPGLLADDSRYVREAVLGRMMQASYINSGGQLAALGTGGPQVASFNTGADAQAMALGYDGKHLAPPPSSGAAFWTRAYGAWGDFDGDGDAASADRDLGGFLSGIDAQISTNWRAGLAAGGAWSNVSVADRHSHADIESVNLAAYVGGMAGAFALRGGGAWTWSSIDTDRAVVFPGFFERQSTGYDADTGQLFGEIAYPMTAGRVALEPFAGLAYVGIDTDSFRERGGVLSPLTGSGDDEDVGYSTLGLRAATVMQVANATVVPKISAAWQHAFDDVTPGASLAFATTGIGFVIDGIPLAQDSFLLEAGLDLALSPTATLGVSYTGQFASDISDNGVKGRFTWLF